MISFDKKLLWLNTREIHIKSGAYIEAAEDRQLISLTESVFENGILKPLIIRKVSIKGYELVSGYRRLLAAKKLRLRRVPCIVCIADDKEAALIRLNDNLCRVIPSYLSEAKEIDSLIKSYNIPYDELATKLGLTRSELLKKLSVLKLEDDLLLKIKDANLGEDFAILLLNTPSKLRQNALDVIIAESLSLPQAERLVSSMQLSVNTSLQNVSFQAPLKEEALKDDEIVKEPPPVKAQIGDMRLFSNSLSRLVDTMKTAGVKIKSSTTDTKKYTEYKVRIEKPSPPKDSAQLKMSLR